MTSCEHNRVGENAREALRLSMQPVAEELRRKLLREGELVLEIKVIPRARVAEVAEPMANGLLKVKVIAAPEKGKANEEVCAVLAKFLDVPRRCVEVILGNSSRQKRVRVRL